MAMKKTLEHEDVQELEILKAVAQAWHSHSGSSRPTNEYDAHQRNFKTKPSLFKLEAMNKSSARDAATANWDFRQSLWDSYEIVTVTKRLETGLVLDNPFTGLDDSNWIHSKRHKERIHNKRHKESKNSLRNIFNRMSSRSIEAVIPHEDREDDTKF